jgi:hypothetical protein
MSLCHGLCVGGVGIRKHSVNYRRETPGSIDPIFLWLIGGDYRKVPFDDQLRRSSKMAATADNLDFGFRRLQENRLGRLIRFLCGSLVVTRGRFLSMISSAAHPRWLLRPPSWILFQSITGQTPGSIDPIFLWLIGGHWRKVPFDMPHLNVLSASLTNCNW